MNKEQKMNAWVLEDLGRICYKEQDMPSLGEREVLVAVKAAGICGSDIPRIYRTGAYHYPLIPGHEFSGQVVQVQDEKDSSWLNQRVGIFPLIPCKNCMPCRKKQYEMCRNYSYLGSRRDGGFAELVSVPVQNLLSLPENVTYAQAAMLEPMAVAVHAVRRLSLSSPSRLDSVVICGLGTIGMLVLMFLLEAGVKNVLVLGNKEFQEKTVTDLGLSKENYCDIRTRDAAAWIAGRTENMGPQVFFECVGKNETYAQAVRAAAPSGKIMLVGNPASDMALPRDVYWRILRNQLTVMGTWNSSFLHEPEDDWNYVLGRLAKKRITPADMITHRFALEGLEQGFHMMRDKTEDYVKVMVAV